MIRLVARAVDRVKTSILHYARIPYLFRGFSGTSYYNGNGAKTRAAKVIDYLYLFFVLKMLPSNYHLFRFDGKKRCEFKAYLDEPNSPVLVRKLFTSLWPKAYIVLVHDKYIFHCLCKHHHLPVPEAYGLYERGVLRESGCSLSEFMARNRISRVVLKPIDGAQGRGIHFLSLENVEQFESQAAVKNSQEPLLAQEMIEQHPRMNLINEFCVNSIRLISILRSDGEVEFLGAMLRTSSSMHPVDNFSGGGVVVGIDVATGRLKREGFSKPPHGTVLTNHPVSGTEFDGFEIPFWGDIKETATRGQKLFHPLKSIGWDIAVSPKGPVIIEGNQQWGTAGIQAANGGLLSERNRALLAQHGLRFYD